MAAAVARLASGNQAKSTDGTEMLTAPETEQSDAAPAPFESESGAMYSTARLWDDGILEPAQTREALTLGLSMAANAPVEETKFGVFRM